LTELFTNKRFVYAVSGLIIFVIIIILAVNLLSSERKELNLLREHQKEMMMLRDEFITLRQKMNAVESRKNLSNVQGIIQAVDEVFSSLGLKDKVKAVKSTAKRETKDGYEEEADVSIEKVSMNEMVNIFYKVENAPMILSIKKATIKKSFENPELLNITLVLSFLKAK